MKMIRSTYDSFGKTVSSINSLSGSPVPAKECYILAPLDFYDPWKEVSFEGDLPAKYIPASLGILSTILGVSMPMQRNLYAMSAKNSEDIKTLTETMEQNFESMSQNIRECQADIAWLQKRTQELASEIDGARTEAARVADEQAQEIARMRIENLEFRQQILCMLDPVVFAVDRSVNIAGSDSNSAEARVGLCFGPEMTPSFFADLGLKYVGDEQYESVTRPYQF